MSWWQKGRRGVTETTCTHIPTQTFCGWVCSSCKAARFGRQAGNTALYPRCFTGCYPLGICLPAERHLCWMNGFLCSLAQWLAMDSAGSLQQKALVLAKPTYTQFSLSTPSNPEAYSTLADKTYPICFTVSSQFLNIFRLVTNVSRQRATT